MGKDARICISLCLRAHGSLGSGLGGLFSQGLPFSQSLAVSRRAGKQSPAPWRKELGSPAPVPVPRARFGGAAASSPSDGPKLGGRQAVLVLVVPWLGSIGVPAGSRVPHPLGISCLSHVYLGCPAWGRCRCLPLNFPPHRSPAWPCPELIPALLGSSPKFLRDRGERTIKA